MKDFTLVRSAVRHNSDGRLWPYVAGGPLKNVGNSVELQWQEFRQDAVVVAAAAPCSLLQSGSWRMGRQFVGGHIKLQDTCLANKHCVFTRENNDEHHHLSPGRISSCGTASKTMRSYLLEISSLSIYIYMLLECVLFFSPFNGTLYIYIYTQLSKRDIYAACCVE